MRAAGLVAIVLHFTQWNSAALASIDVSSIVGSYVQDFDGLASAFNNDSVIWTNDVTLTGWNLFRVPGGVEPPGPAAILRYIVGSGGSGNGRFYSFGDEGELDRALGGVGNGNFGDGLTAATPPKP